MCASDDGSIAKWLSFLGDPDLIQDAIDAFALVRSEGCTPNTFAGLVEDSDAFPDHLFEALVEVLMTCPGAEHKLPPMLWASGPTGTYLPLTTYSCFARRTMPRDMIMQMLLTAPTDCKVLAFSIAAPRRADTATGKSTGYLTPECLGFAQGLPGLLEFLDELRRTFNGLDEWGRGNVLHGQLLNRRGAAFAQAALRHLGLPIFNPRFHEMCKYLEGFIVDTRPRGALTERELQSWSEGRPIAPPRAPSRAKRIALESPVRGASTPPRQRASKRRRSEDHKPDVSGDRKDDTAAACASGVPSPDRRAPRAKRSTAMPPVDVIKIED